MNNLKIRVWDDELKEMTYMETWEKILSWKPEMYEENIVMLNTTVEDVNFRDIYVGDILKVYSDEIGTHIPNEFIGEVRLIEGKYLVMNDNAQLAFNLWQEITEWKVIGNIYESEFLLDEIR
ncbi:MAG: hypothetical protein FH761_17790 [Firmicutes bacterium]|nr:hypothetical protein [Bacillota bacterium]